MKTYEEFKKTVYEALENSNITPDQVIEHEAAITFSIPNDDETPEYLKNLSSILEAEQIRIKSSVSVPSQINSISISVFNH